MGVGRKGQGEALAPLNFEIFLFSCYVFSHSKLIFKTTENHHAGKTFMLVPLLFPWLRSDLPTCLILESPLTT